MCPVVPLGVPHGSLENVEVLDKWAIPKGSMIMVNHWAMNYNPEVYENPTTFQPLRFLKDVPKPIPFQVSFLKQICFSSCKNRSFFTVFAILFCIHEKQLLRC